MVYHATESQHENICKSLEFNKNKKEKKRKKNPCEFHILQMLLFIWNINGFIPQDIHKCAYLLCTSANCKRHDGKAGADITFFEVSK